MSLANPEPSQLPRSEETWQVALLRLPLWMEPEDHSPFRPWCVLALRLPVGALLENLTPEETEPSAGRVGERLVEAAGEVGALPGRLQVADAGFAGDLRQALAPYGLDVEQVESLPELDEATDALIRELFEEEPGLLAGEGVTLEQVASFAEAAASLARAQPWRHLAEIDRLQIEAPERGLARLACVLGWTGPERGLLFSPELGQEPWLIHFTAPWMIAAHDLYLWERHGLAVAGEEDHPRVSTPAGDGRRPDSRLLDIFEGVLRALAVTTEDEMDSGLWEKTVETGLGPVRLVLSLPDLLHPPEVDWDDELDDFEDLAGEEWLDDLLPEEDPEEDEQEPVPIPGLTKTRAEEMEKTDPSRSPEMEAQKRVYQAWEALGRRRVALARQALALWPGCADAWTLLAEHERDPHRAVSLYARAVEETGRSIDPVLFEKPGCPFWSGHESQPYLSTRLGLAEALWEAGRCEEAVAHFQEMLRLDPRDRQGVRGRLAAALRVLETGPGP
ncbi:MAG TPA: tetratricopeptide repeat protein [Thermoanaerobaculia bacterium]|jgi:tetratricopeptide (TPR) repeat protein|nr:tetratricopeptide repeat protein [Thermoanaerobaculia bacterium]